MNEIGYFMIKNIHTVLDSLHPASKNSSMEYNRQSHRLMVHGSPTFT